MILIIPPSEQELEALARRQYNRSLDLSPYRGTIFDRRGEQLAISTRKPSILVNPRVFNPTPSQTRSLAQLLGIKASFFREISGKPTYFYWVKRKVSHKLSEQVRQLNIKGIHQRLEPSRHYPSGLASQLIGYVGTDNTGLLGIEHSFDQLLRGHNSKNLISTDAKGQVILNDPHQAAPQSPGKNLHLTLDRVIQEISEVALARGVTKAKGKSGFAIISDPHTGHILAIANYPKFDPNNSKSITPSNSRNFALLDLFEPGSVVKPLVVARALDRKVTTMDEEFATHDGYYSGGKWRIRDTHGYEKLSTKDIVVNSSNIGTYKIAQKIGRQALAEAFTDFGVGLSTQKLGVAQRYGKLPPWQNWKDLRFANISFGQGFTVNGLEIAQAFSAIANGGQLMKPILVDKVVDESGKVVSTSSPAAIKRVLSPSTSSLLKQALSQVVTEGTGQNAKSSYYTTAGKTGTSEKYDPVIKTYSKSLRIASFAGFAPVEDPHLVIYVVIDEPQIKPYYGGIWAAPVFKEIAEKSLKYLNVKPDLMTLSKAQPAPTKRTR